MVPAGLAELLELKVHGELGALSSAWIGWKLTQDRLVSPEGWTFAPGDVLSLPFNAQRAQELERQVRALLASFEVEPDRRRRDDLYRQLLRTMSSAIATLEELGVTCEAARPADAACLAPASR